MALTVTKLLTKRLDSAIVHQVSLCLTLKTPQFTILAYRARYNITFYCWYHACFRQFSQEAYNCNEAKSTVYFYIRLSNSSSDDTKPAKQDLLVTK